MAYVVIPLAGLLGSAAGAGIAYLIAKRWLFR
jgi:hypothetical protein